MNSLNTCVERKKEAKYSELKIPCSPQWVSAKKILKMTYEDDLNHFVYDRT